MGLGLAEGGSGKGGARTHARSRIAGEGPRLLQARPLSSAACVWTGAEAAHIPHRPHPASLRTLWSAAWGALSYTATTASRRAGCQVPLKPMKSMRAGPPDAVPGKWRSRVRTPEKRVTLACVCVEGEREGRA